MAALALFLLILLPFANSLNTSDSHLFLYTVATHLGCVIEEEASDAFTIGSKGLTLFVIG